MLKHGAMLAGLVACVFSTSAHSGVIENGRLPDGVYQCSLYNGSSNELFGDVLIRGMTYQGPAYDGKYEGGPYPYVLSGKVVLWRGPLMGFTEGGNKVGATVITGNDPAHPTFDVTVMTAPPGESTYNAHVVTCAR